jgi:hypothetical protein
MAGKTPQFKTATFPGNHSTNPGVTVSVRIESATGHSLSGAIA